MYCVLATSHTIRYNNNTSKISDTEVLSVFLATVCGCYLTVVYPILSVTLLYCGQTVGWINIPLDMEAGLGPGHIVLYGDPAPPTESGTAAAIL